MKKMLISLMAMMTSVALHALPIGNPWEASLLCDGIFCKGNCPEFCSSIPSWCHAWSVRIGFTGDFVFNRHMEVDTSTSDASIHQTEIYTQAGYLALNVWNRFDLFGTLGATNISIKSPEKTFGDIIVGNDYGYLETDTHFSWSIGIRGTLWRCGCLGIGAEAQYFQTRPNVNFTREDANPVRYPDAEVRYYEWQVGVGLAYRINIVGDATAFVPYAGVKWSRAHFSTDNLTVLADGQTFFDLESERNWGYAIGVTLVGCNKISVTAEVRFSDENAFYVNSQFRF